MSVTLNTRKSFSTFKSKFSSVNGVNFFAVQPVSQQKEDEAAFNSSDRPSAGRVALEELEEKYKSLLESVRVEKFNPKYISRYIASAEKRRGAPFTPAERKRIKEMATSKDPEVIRLLALELRIGVPRKIERDALAAMGNIMLHREDAALREFLCNPNKDPNLTAYVKTILMMSHVETWMDRYTKLKQQYGSLVRPLEWVIPDLDFTNERSKRKKEQEEQKNKKQKPVARKKKAPASSSEEKELSV